MNSLLRNYFCLFFLSFFISGIKEVKADACVHIDDTDTYEVSLNCGFNLIEGIFKKDGIVRVKGQTVCKGNRLGPIPLPCMLHVESKKEGRSCTSSIVYNDKMVIRADVFNLQKQPKPLTSYQCLTH